MYQIVSLAGFRHLLRLRHEKRNLPESRQLVKLKLNKFYGSFCGFPCWFVLGSFEYMLMLLVSTIQIRATNQMVWKYAGSYLHYSIDTQTHETYLVRKTSKDRLPLPVVNLDKASVCGDRKTSFSFWQKRKFEIHIYREFRSVGRDSYLGAQYW